MQDFSANLVKTNLRSSPPEVLLEKAVLEICSKFTGEHPCQSAISIKLQNNFIEIALWHGCSLVNLLHIFRTSFLKNTSGWLLLDNLYVSLIKISQYRILRYHLHFLVIQAVASKKSQNYNQILLQTML